MIAISDTKINENTSLNLNLPHYHFHHSDSPTNADEVGMYISQSLNFKIRNDLLLNVPNCKDLWIEIMTSRGNIIFAVVSRPQNVNFHLLKILCAII